MIDMHTGGRWKGTIPELSEHVRPIFLHLVPQATQHNIRIAIVTFSSQTQLIREVLDQSFPEISELIPIRGSDGSWTYAGNGKSVGGKQKRMASAAEELMTKPALGVSLITKSTTLLIDDDPRNISISLKDGTRAVWFNPRNPDRLLDDILCLE